MSLPERPGIWEISLSGIAKQIPTLPRPVRVTIARLTSPAGGLAFFVCGVYTACNPATYSGGQLNFSVRHSKTRFMLTEFKHKASIGVGAGLLLIIVGRVILKFGESMAIVGAVALLAGSVLFIWGCCQYAKAKGYSGWWGLLGFLSVIGLLILFFFRDQHRESETRIMSSRGLLRTLLIAEICLVVVGVAVSLLTEPSLPEPLRTFLEAEAEADITGRDKSMLATVIPAIILWITSSIGLFFFWRPARTLYVITIAVGLLMTPFSGPYVNTGWAATFEEAAIIVSGVILALIYVSPLKDLFDKPKIAA